MLRLILDVILIVILALCVWHGFRRGLIGSIAGILVVIIALFGGNLLSSAYAGEVIPALEPFVDGFISSQQTRDEILDKMGYDEFGRSLEDILNEDPSLRYDYAYACMDKMGFSKERCKELSAKAVQLDDGGNISTTDAVVDVLCDTITHVGGLVLAFLMILIALVAVGNLTNISFRLPNLVNFDEISGAVLGFIKGFMYCALLCWALGFLGALIGKTTLDKSTLGSFFSQMSFITKGLL